MIIHLKKYKEHGYLKAIGLIGLKLFLTSKYKVLTKKKEDFSIKGYSHFPHLNFTSDAKWNCTSCYLCSEICPSSCIEISGEKNTRSLIEGKNPKQFSVDLSRCSQCQLCVDVCPTAALHSNGIYPEDSFKAPLELIEYNKKA